MTSWTCCFCYHADIARNVMPIEFLDEGFHQSSFYSSIYYAHVACIEEHFDHRVGFSRKRDAFVELTNNAQFLVADPPKWHCCFCYQEDLHENVRIAKVIKTGRTPKEQVFAAHPKCMTHHFNQRMGILHNLTAEESAWRETIHNEVFHCLEKSLFEVESVPLMNMLTRAATRTELRTVLREQNEKRELGASDYQIRKILNLLMDIVRRHPMPKGARCQALSQTS